MKNSTIKTVLLLVMLLLPMVAMAESGSVRLCRPISSNPSTAADYDTYTNITYSFAGGSVKKESDSQDNQVANKREIYYLGTIKEGDIFNGSISITNVTNKSDITKTFRAHVAVVETSPEKVLPITQHNCYDGNGFYSYTAIDCNIGDTPSANLSFEVPKGMEHFTVYLEISGFHKYHGFGYETIDFSLRIDYTVKDKGSSLASTEDVSYVEEDNDASSDSGPWGYFIPLSVILALTGFALTRKKDKNGNDEKEQPSVTFEMQVYKDFGNSLLVGDAPRQVLARIVAHTAQGSFTDPQMTAMIQFETGDGYLQVRDAGMVGDWRAAWITAPELPSVPDDAVLTAKMVNGEAGFVNRLHFLVETGEVLFGQDNLTMPAFYKKEVRLPFVVVGIDPQKDPVEATITQSGKPSQDYKVRVEWSEKDQMHYAIINDLVLDEEQHPGVPGKYITYKLNIKATRSSGSEVKGGITMFRYYMGLAIKVKDIKCFIEEHEPLNHKLRGVGVHARDKYYVPAETRVCLTLYDYDEEHNQLLKLYPIPYYNDKTKEVGFKVTAKDTEKQYMVDKLGMQIVATQGIDPENGRICLMRCCSHMLAAPNRLAASLEVTVKYNDREYKSSVGVRLCSQPVRHFVSDQDWAAAQKEDKRISDQLDHIANEIYRQHLVDNLFPLLKFIKLLRESHDEDQSFGYDKRCLQTVSRTYADVFSGRKAGANADPGPRVTWLDELEMGIIAWFDAARTVQQNMGLLGNLFVGVFAPWVSTAFTVVEILGDMRDYAMNGGDSIMEGWCVGAKVVVQQYIMGKMMEKGFAKAQSMGFTPENMNLAFEEMSGINVADFWTKSKLSYLTKEIHIFNKSTAQAKVDADDLMNDVGLKGKAGAGKNKIDLDEATSFGRARANQNVQDLRAACEMYRANPTPTNKALRDKIIMQCQGDKQTMYLLKQKGIGFNATRKDFNGHLKDLYARTDAAVEAELSKRLGGKPVRPKCMSSKSRADLDEGLTLTLDRDATYQYLDSDGTWKTIKNQKLVEKIYNEKFYNESTGGFKADTNDAPLSLKENIEARYGKKMDQTIIQDELTHPESYGPDVEKMLGGRHGDALDDAMQVGGAVKYKGMERFERGRQLFEEAKMIKNPLERVKKQADAIGEMMEGGRQEVKIFDQFTVPRDLDRANINGGSQISPKLKTAVEVVRKFESGATLDEVETALAKIGYTFESFAEDMGNTMIKIG